MNGTVLLFGFDSLLSILALEAAVGPLGAEVVPVAKTDYNKTLAVLAGLDTAPGPRAALRRGTLGRKNGSAVRAWMASWCVLAALIRQAPDRNVSRQC